MRGVLPTNALAGVNDVAEHQDDGQTDPGSPWWFDQPTEEWVEQEHAEGGTMSPSEGSIARIETPFWATWLSFSSKELSRLRFQRWRFRQLRLRRNFSPTIPAQPSATTAA